MTTANLEWSASTDAIRGPGQTKRARFHGCLSLMRSVLDRQRQRRALLALDDHLLNDIGKSKREALAEARKPFWK